MTTRPTAASDTRQPWETTPETRARKEPDPVRDLGPAKDVLTGGRAWIDHGYPYLATPAEQPQKARIPDARQ
jgi:hypothetical protein